MIRLVMGVALVVSGVVAGAGCQVVAGVDFDSARLDGEVGDAGSSSPATVGPDGSIVVPGDTDGGAGPVASDCTPDPNSVTCADRCGPTEDNCKSSRACSTDCGVGKTCVDGKCACASEQGWCANRCGQTEDNCGRSVDCGACENGAPCENNTCGCAPEPVATTCAGKACGTATNNCGQLVACGNGGACATPGAICKPDGSCCSDDGTACKDRCASVTVTNNCGVEVGCPGQCPTGKVCVGSSCCTPEPLATTCAGVACGPRTYNCGQVVTCPDTCISPQTCGGGGAGPNACGCTPTGDPCNGRCSGIATNNCGQKVTCNNSCGLLGECPCRGGVCDVNGFCNCTPGPCF